MKSPTFSAMAVVAGFNASVASAASTDTQSNPNADKTTAAALRSALEQFRGDFDLNDGRTLTLSRRGQSLLVEISGEPAQEIRAQTPTRFATVGGNTAIEFHQLANGIGTNVTVTETGNKATPALARKVANPG